jgi:minor extracellular serine protease Vpr
MKKVFTIIFALITLNVSIAQNLKANVQMPIKLGEPAKSNLSFSSKGLSPYTAFLISDLKLNEKRVKSSDFIDSSIIIKYGLMKINNILYANSFLLVTENYDESQLFKFGFLSGSRSGQFITGLIPIDKINEISQIETVKYIQIGEPVKALLDEAKAKTWVNEVHTGTGLPQSYLGNGVVVGIIDGGFDYTHRNFYDGTGSNNYRIKRVWEQAGVGTPPSGYSYGSELTTQLSILNAQTDDYNASHGTHVTGIAAGAGGGASSAYVGVAPQSDIVLVAYKNTASIADAIAYIINYATSVGKPCVINMSLGQHTGPHDGTSIFDQYCDGIVGAGKILVGAAGNEGSKPLYFGKTYTTLDTVLYSFVKFPYSSKGTNGETSIDIWGNQNQNFYVAVNIYNSNTNTFEDYTPYISANSNSTNNYTLYDKDIFSPDDCSINIKTEINYLNKKPRITVSIDNTAQDDNYRWAMIEIIAYNTQTKMWADDIQSSPGHAEFTTNGKGYPWVNGSTNSTMGEIGGTGKNIITVGAYNTKNSWTALNGSGQSTGETIDAIADFSSKGPTADGRTKPDITAPGNVIVSSVNSFDENNYPNNSNEVVSGVSDGTNNWYFAKMEGTSMASPMVTGILALWLQAYPNLTPTQAKTLMKDNAYTDGFTGTIPTNGSNTWGWGKIDAQYGLIDLLSKIPAQPVISPSGTVSICQGQSATLSAPNGFSSYEWSPSGSTQNKNISTAGSYKVRVTNSQGFISPWSALKTVSLVSNPVIPSISQNGKLLTSSSSTGNQWYLNGVIISGAKQQTFLTQQSGSYYVKVTNTNNCYSQSSSVLMNFAGVDEVNENSIFTVFPNPFNGELNIQFSELVNIANVEVYDISGRQVYNKIINNTSSDQPEVLKLENLSTGMYNLRIEINGNISNYKIIKE